MNTTGKILLAGVAAAGTWGLASHTAQASFAASSAGYQNFNSTSGSILAEPTAHSLGYIFYGTDPAASPITYVSSGSQNGSYPVSTSSYSTFTGTFTNPVSWATISMPQTSPYNSYGYAGVNYPDISIGGTTYHVSTYNVGGYGTNVIPNGTTVALLTITLGAGTPSSFQLGDLTDVESDTNVGGKIELFSGSGVTGTPLVSVTDTVPTSTWYNLYNFDITGAAPGDVLTLAGVMNSASNSQMETAGITFTSVPEPAALSLLAVGGLGLLLVKRRKMA